VETEDASLNEEVIVCGSPGRDCCIGGLTRQDEVVITIEAVVLAGVAVPKFQPRCGGSSNRQSCFPHVVGQHTAVHDPMRI
jgi:hypothetical protein